MTLPTNLGSLTTLTSKMMNNEAAHRLYIT